MCYMSLYKRLRLAATITMSIMLTLVSVSMEVDAVSAEVMQVYVSGELAGFSLCDSGPIIVGFEDKSGAKGISPAEQAGLCLGDVIYSIDGVRTQTIDEVKTRLLCAGDTITVTCLRGGESMDIQVTPEDNKTIGCWLRGTFTGIGTVTCYLPEENKLIMLGHSVSDGGKVIPHVEKGNIYKAFLMSVKRGEVNNPGELRACFDYSAPILGRICNNEFSGLYSQLNSRVSQYLNMESCSIMDKHEVKTGNASIICDVDGNGPKAYNVKIESISLNRDEKNMVILVVDNELLNITGGIVQGMSGSPIMQNGKLVGAVTHVLVNDPTRGYGIFIENMLDAAK